MDRFDWGYWLLIKKCEEFAETILEKADKKKVWEDTVAFLAQHGEKGYKGLHQHIQSQKATSAPKVKAAAPAPPQRPGTRENESTHTNGTIKNKAVAYPHKHPDGTTEMRHRSMNVQEKHHFTWKDGKWNHTHTTQSGTGLNSKK